MAQSKLNDWAGRLGNNPKGLGLGLKLLAFAGAGIYGLNQAMFTGENNICIVCHMCLMVCHRLLSHPHTSPQMILREPSPQMILREPGSLNII